VDEEARIAHDDGSSRPPARRLDRRAFQAFGLKSVARGAGRHADLAKVIGDRGQAEARAFRMITARPLLSASVGLRRYQ